MQEQIKKLEAKIQKQGRKISKLKKEWTVNEYTRLIDRLRASENELTIAVKEQQEEIEELKKEVFELLEIISLSKEVEDEKII